MLLCIIVSYIYVTYRTAKVLSILLLSSMLLCSVLHFSHMFSQASSMKATSDTCAWLSDSACALISSSQHLAPTTPLRMCSIKNANASFLFFCLQLFHSLQALGRVAIGQTVLVQPFLVVAACFPWDAAAPFDALLCKHDCNADHNLLKFSLYLDNQKKHTNELLTP